MEIFIVDSHAYSMAEGAGVIEAKQKLDAGETMESVVEYLNDKYAKMEILLTAYTLKVIRKSGGSARRRRLRATCSAFTRFSRSTTA